jgi:hypothetical protein
MPKFKKEKKVIRKQVGGDFPYEEGPALFRLVEGIRSDMAKDIVPPREAAARARRMGLAAAEPKIQPLRSLSQFASPGLASLVDKSGRPFASPGSRYGAGISGFDLAGSSIARALSPVDRGATSVVEDQKPIPPAVRAEKKATTGRPKATPARPSDKESFSGYPEYNFMVEPGAPVAATAAAPSRNVMRDYDTTSSPASLKEMSSIFKQAAKAPGAPADMAKAAGEIPKTKSGLKKFMQEYGKFIALGAMAGQGGKGGQIAAPIIAALPGLIEMMKSKKKSSGGEPPKKSEGGAIRKFKGGSMKGNTKDSMLTPKYKKGGATGEMPQHKKMAMGKPTPQSMKQKFAKGGTMKCASGGVPKGYGISKKIRPTGPMN